MAKEKKAKKKGPLRTEAILPLTVLILLFGLYFKYYFDSHLRWAIEYGATQAYGAEVNVGSLHTNFFAPSIQIRNIQVTDKSNPALNLVQVGEVKLQLLWDALLRGKFVIPESSVLKIQAKSKRRHPGRILPPKPPSNEKGEVEKAAEKTVQQLEQKNKANLLGDVFAVAGGTDVKAQLKKMESQLKSQQQIKTLEAELKQKEKEWKDKIDNLPDDSELKQLAKKVEGLKIDTSNPKAIQDSLKKIDGVYKEAREKYKTVENTKKAFQEDVKKYESEYKNLEKMIQEDISGITEKLNIPSLDPKEINQMLLGNLIASQIGGLYKYKNVVREYMPTKTAAERKAEKENQALTPMERANGVNYKFPKKKSYPLFWLQKASISSSSNQGEAGDLKGTLTDLTDNPRHLGKPTEFNFSGGFPHQKIMGISGNITIDHTTEVPLEKGTLIVGSFPIKENTLTKSNDVELGYKNADGSSNLQFLLKEQTLQITSQSLFENVEYYTQAKDPKVAQILTSITQDLRSLDLNVKATGSWSDISLHINSNLGSKLSNAIKGQISGEIQKARQQVEDHVRNLLGSEQGKLKGQMSQIEKSLGVSLKSREDAIKSVEQAVNQKKNSASKQETKKLENEAKKEVKKLLKGIKF